MTDNVIQFNRVKKNAVVVKKTSNENENIEENVQKAIKMRDDWLASLEGDRKKDGADLQEKIDLSLKKAGNLNNRMTIINNMMMDSFFQLNDVLQELVSVSKNEE